MDCVLYNRIFNELSHSTCTEKDLSRLKLHFEEDIRSQRRLDRISTLEQLIKILEKRDNLNEITISFIANSINRGDILSINNNNLQKRVLPEVPTGTNERVFGLIADEIGPKWKDFARALEIKESYIAELNDCHKKISDRVYEILNYHKNSYCGVGSWRTAVLEALATARRNDLRKKVQILFDQS